MTKLLIISPQVGASDMTVKSSHGTLAEAVAAAKATLQYGNTEAQVGDLVTGEVVFDTTSPSTI